MKVRLTNAALLLLTFAASPLFAQKFPPVSEAQRLKMLEPPTNRPVRMVLDTDTFNEIDDQFAVVYAMISPELDVQAVYAAPFHNSRSSGPGDGMEKSYEEILRILSRLDKDPAGFAFKGSTNYVLDVKKPEKSPAVLDLIERAKKSSPDDPLYVVPVGAITNVANAILLEPSIIKNIVVVWLGGNGLNWPHQREFNYRQDLNASRVIFDCGVAFVQLPCTPVVTHFRTTGPGNGTLRSRSWGHRRLPVGDLHGLSQGPFRLVQGVVGHDGRGLGGQRQMAPLRSGTQPHCDGQLHVQLRQLATPDPLRPLRRPRSDLPRLLHKAGQAEVG